MFSTCYSPSVSPNSTIMLGQRTSIFLLQKLHPFPNGNLQSFIKFRCMIDLISPKFTVSSSLASIIASGNAITAAAAAAGSSTTVAHAAVTSTITQVAVTAVAIASGACLSTKVDFLWPKSEEQPSSLVLDGVDVTGYPIFSEPKVQKAISFAKNAHHGQWRKTGEPYLTHCIYTGKIVAALVPSSGARAVNTVAAGILHDVVDDTDECLLSVREEFGDDVTKMVAGVSRLSYINQLLRRKRRINTSHTNISYEEANNLRVMLLGMVDDPRVVLIKLADRLHNMRTIYALPLSKAQAVAHETLFVWCSLASRLGLWALKAELEDLCFAVLQPKMFSQIRAELASMWSPCRRRTGNLRRLSVKNSLFPSLDGSPLSNTESSVPVFEDDTSMKDLLQAVLPFDLLLDRRKRITFLNSMMKCNNSQIRPKVVKDARIALESLSNCEEVLERELLISTSYVPGMEVTISSRLKSLYSIYSKMKRKDVGISEVYDARALRVIIGDKNGTLHGSAVTSCYSILDIVHRLWSPIDGEFDDYIVNPKPSGYQSLHTAVQGPDNAPLEVQIRTQRMHKDAEHGNAAHWIYKEAEGRPLSAGSMGDAEPFNFPRRLDRNPMADDMFRKYTSLRAGHPVLRVEGSHLLAAVITSVDKDGKELLVAVSFGLSAYEEVAERRSSSQIQRWEAYAQLYKKVCDEWWFEPGHGDWCTCLEKYTLCRDGIYHKQDQFDRLLPTFIQIIHLTAKEENEYWGIVSAVFEDRDVKSIESSSEIIPKSFSDSISAASTESSINNKVLLLRTMLQWEEQLCSKVGIKQNNRSGKSLALAGTIDLGEVAVVSWPHGDIIRLRTGSTAADAARRVGLEGKLVWVNGQPVLPNTELKDGDVVEVRL